MRKNDRERSERENYPGSLFFVSRGVGAPLVVVPVFPPLDFMALSSLGTCGSTCSPRVLATKMGFF